jgi:serine phosphatase RsbU (regulator of sigma subunit)
LQEAAAINFLESGLSDTRKTVDELIGISFEVRNSNLARSLQLAQKAHEISDKIGYNKGKADGLLQIAFSHMHTAKHEESFNELLRCMEIYNELGDETGIANAKYNLGLLQLRIGNFEDSITAFHSCLTYREKQNDLAGVAMCYFQMTYIYQHFEDQEGAYEAATKCLEIREQLGDRNGTGAILMILGEILRKRKDFVKAKQMLEKSLALRKESVEKMGEFATLLRWSELHMDLEDYETAEKCLYEGLQIATEENVNFGVLRFLQVLSNLYYRVDNIRKSKELITQAIEYAEKYSFKSVLYELHKSCAEICEVEGEYKKALEHYRKYTSIKEEVINFQSSTRLKSAQLMNKIEFAQKEAELEKTKNTALNEAYKIISEKNKEITDSINYAQRIQKGILPSAEQMQETLTDYFILYRPKDIVSGDFFWATKKINEEGNALGIVAAIDCTGHGVPGAFMSMLGHTLLNQTIKNASVQNPAQILDFLNEELPKTIHSYGQEMSIRDGMDISLCAIDFKNAKLFYAGANNPCWIVRNKNLIVLQPDKQVISAAADCEKKNFSNREFELEKGDLIYLFTDGYADQFGGPKGKKFKYRQLSDLLLSTSAKEMKNQKQVLETAFENWKGQLEQVDDVCIIGIKI